MDKLEATFASVNVAFRAFDKDRTGTISTKEFRFMCKERFNLPIRDEILDEILAHLDTDKSGFVEFSEIQQGFGEAIIHSSKGTFLGKLGANKPQMHSLAAPPTTNASLVTQTVRTCLHLESSQAWRAYACMHIYAYVAFCCF